MCYNKVVYYTECKKRPHHGHLENKQGPIPCEKILNKALKRYKENFGNVRSKLSDNGRKIRYHSNNEQKWLDAYIFKHTCTDKRDNNDNVVYKQEQSWVKGECKKCNQGREAKKPNNTPIGVAAGVGVGVRAPSEKYQPEKNQQAQPAGGQEEYDAAQDGQANGNFDDQQGFDDEEQGQLRNSKAAGIAPAGAIPRQPGKSSSHRSQREAQAPAQGNQLEGQNQVRNSKVAEPAAGGAPPGSHQSRREAQAAAPQRNQYVAEPEPGEVGPIQPGYALHVHSQRPGQAPAPQSNRSARRAPVQNQALPVMEGLSLNDTGREAPRPNTRRDLPIQAQALADQPVENLRRIRTDEVSRTSRAVSTAGSRLSTARSTAHSGDSGNTQQAMRP